MAKPEALALFNHLQQDLRSVRPDLPNEVILCPLCLQVFKREALECVNAPLTIEHIVPGGVGGTWKTLTCKRCNNEQGSALDAHLVRRIMAHNSLAGQASARPLKGKLECEGRQLGMDFGIVLRNDGQAEHVMRMKSGGPPGLLDRFSQRLASGKMKDITFELSLNYIEERSRLAMIRVAYLLLFATRGYRYILGEGPSVIRKLLSGEIPLHGQEIWRLADQIEDWKLDREDIALGFVTLSFFSPERVLGYMIIFRIGQGKARYFSALMPEQDERAENVIPQLHVLSNMIKGHPLTVKISLDHANVIS